MSTKNTITPQQQLAWDTYQNLQAAIKDHQRLFLVIGKMLKDVRDYKLYRQMGEGGFDTFQHFLENPEIGIRYPTAYLYIRLFEYYIERLSFEMDKISAIPVNRLMRVLPKLKERSDEEARDIVEELGEMTSWDFDQIVKEKKLDIKRPRLIKCKECGKYKFEYYESMMCSHEGKIHIVNLSDLVAVDSEGNEIHVESVDPDTK